MAVSSATYLFILNTCYDWNGHAYATTKELKKKAFAKNNQNKNQEISIQVTFILESKLQKCIFNHSLVIF